MLLSLATLAATLGLSALGAPAAGAVTYSDPGFVDQDIVGGLDVPTAIAFNPAGDMFINEKGGKLLVLDKGASTPRLLIDLRPKVNTYGDRGLLGLAVDSDFSNPSRAFLYVSYTHRVTGTEPQDPGRTNSRFSRFPITTDGSGKVHAGTEKVLIGAGGGDSPCVNPSPGQPGPDCLPSDSDTHSIGTVRSAPDGTLFVGQGDGAAVDGPNAGNGTDHIGNLRTYDENNLAGKILRVDRDGKGLPGHSFCPTDNNLTHNCTKVYSKGLRNPFRFALRAGSSTRLILGDVGWGYWEELNLIDQGGGNYAWPCFEGNHQTVGASNVPECSAVTNTPPVYEYEHQQISPGTPDRSAAIVGGPEYQGGGKPGAYPTRYNGSLFFGDYALGFLRRLVPDGDGGYNAEEFGTGFSGVDIVPTPEGDLAYVDIARNSVVRMKYAPGGQVPTLRVSTTPAQLYGGTLPFGVQFNTAGSSAGLTYDWDFGDGTAHSTAANPSHTYTTATNADGQAFTATVTAKNSSGLIARKQFTISPQNTPPTPTMTSPASGFKYVNGQTVELNGGATDPEDGTANIRWDVYLIHNAHAHFLLTSFGSGPTFRPVLDHDSDSHYAIKLTATDSKGLTNTVTREIYAQTVKFGLNSSPAGAPVTYADTAATAPFSRNSAVNFHTTVSAAARFSRGGRTYAFHAWSDGGARSHGVVVPSTARTLTASYRDVTPAKPKQPAKEPNAGPTLTINPKTSLDRRRRTLSGSVSDSDGVKQVEVALGQRVRGRGDRCRWVARRLGRIAKRRGRCARPVWMGTHLTRKSGKVRWRVRFGRALRPGSYRVYVRAADDKGASGDRFSGAKRDYVRLAVKRSRRR